jgi:beta-lactamase class A
MARPSPHVIARLVLTCLAAVASPVSAAMDYGAADYGAAGYGYSRPRSSAPAPTLSGEIAALLREMRRKGLVQPDERTAWSVYDISRDAELANINGDAPLQTASLIKPFIALAYFDSVAGRERKYTASERRRMEAMIRDSDNAAANWFLRELGGPESVQLRLNRDHAAMLRDVSLVEYIPAGGRTYRNRASVHDYTRFLHELWTDSVSSSEEIKRLMLLPKRNRLKSGASDVPGDTPVYDKTGSTARVCGDMGILVARGSDGRSYPYILVGIIEKQTLASDYGSWIRRRGDVIRAVSNLAYKAIADRYGLSIAAR